MIPFSKVYHVEEHLQIKDELLDYVDLTIENFNLTNKKDQITDYFLNYKFTVSQRFKPYAQKYLNLFISEFKYAKSIEIEDMWFQRYLNKDHHYWHVHPKCHFALVYFLELPDNSIGTKFHNYEVTVNEGDILIFPAFIPHTSPINNTNTRKTVIAANASILE
jgi:hypothetical protein